MTLVHKTCSKPPGLQVYWDTTQLFSTFFVTLFIFLSSFIDACLLYLIKTSVLSVFPLIQAACSASVQSVALALPYRQHRPPCGGPTAWRGFPHSLQTRVGIVAELGHGHFHILSTVFLSRFPCTACRQ